MLRAVMLTPVMLRAVIVLQSGLESTLILNTHLLVDTREQGI